MVTTKYGQIKGVDMGEFMEYRDVPYAKPPVGDLRFKAPQPLEPWEGVLDADTFRTGCMEEKFDDAFYGKEFHSIDFFEVEPSEDCLHLQIWAPKGAKDCPVAFWIHGGAFLGGNACEMEFGGAEYCRRGVILVSVEYRCNIFGFLAHPWLTAESEQGISGNYGILDQIAALDWVYENIAAFGGDPKQITVFGQSAGAMSTQTLISSELTRGKIARAILQSGGSYGKGLHRDMPMADQERYGTYLTDILKVNSLEELRALPAETIVKATGAFFGRVMPETKGLFLTPVMDGYVLDGGYYDLMDQGKIHDISYMIGSTKDDILPDLLEGCTAFDRKLQELGREAAIVYYFRRDLPGDEHGAFHSSELWYMFGTMERCWRPWEKHDLELSRSMVALWTGFMKGRSREELLADLHTEMVDGSEVVIFE